MDFSTRRVHRNKKQQPPMCYLTVRLQRPDDIAQKRKCTFLFLLLITQEQNIILKIRI